MRGHRPAGWTVSATRSRAPAGSIASTTGRRARAAPSMLLAAVLAAAIAACAGGTANEREPGAVRTGDAFVDRLLARGEAARRPVAYRPNPPSDFLRAIDRGTRSPAGAPGPDYWQQWADYDIRARLLSEERRLEGHVRIEYRNESPDTLHTLWLHLIQNVHAPGAVRNEPYELTGGVDLRRVAADGRVLPPIAGEEEHGYLVDGTLMGVRLPEPLPPAGRAELEIDYAFGIPREGAGGRMGWSEDDLFFVAYWYPHMAVYDDVVGWQLDPFLGYAEFYFGYADYRVSIEAPAGWVIRASGTLANPDEVLPARVRERLELAGRSDTVVRILGPGEFGAGRATARSPSGWLAWRFAADSVRDFAFSATRRSMWDAVRASLEPEPADDGRDGEAGNSAAAAARTAAGGPRAGTRMEALYRERAPLWTEVARYGRHALAFHSRVTGVPYPWPHMTAVEGAGIIQGGMEFPMMTLMGDYELRGDTALYGVTAHELGHMWVPMIVGTDEKRRGWMDEGMTVFLTDRAVRDFFPDRPADSLTRDRYRQLAGAEIEGEIMRWSDYHYPGAARTAVYDKPATVLAALRALIGDRAFDEAYRTFHREWAYRHPYPWDLFHTFERVAARDLGWFWRSWFYETWTLDHAVESVTATPNGTRIVVEDRGNVPMPARLRVTRVDGDTLRLEVPVERWLTGARRDTLTVPPGAPLIRVEIDPEGRFPDLRPDDNVWTR